MSRVKCNIALKNIKKHNINMQKYENKTKMLIFTIDNYSMYDILKM